MTRKRVLLYHPKRNKVQRVRQQNWGNMGHLTISLGDVMLPPDHFASIYRRHSRAFLRSIAISVYPFQFDFNMPPSSLLHFWPPRCVQNRPPSTSMRRGIKHYKIGWEIVIKFGMWEQTYYHHYYYVGLGSGQVVILCLKAHSTETHAKPTTWLLRQFHCCCLWWWWRGSWMGWGPTSSTAAQYE